MRSPRLKLRGVVGDLTEEDYRWLQAGVYYSFITFGVRWENDLPYFSLSVTMPETPNNLKTQEDEMQDVVFKLRFDKGEPLTVIARYFKSHRQFAFHWRQASTEEGLELLNDFETAKEAVLQVHGDKYKYGVAWNVNRAVGDFKTRLKDMYTARFNEKLENDRLDRAYIDLKLLEPNAQPVLREATEKKQEVRTFRVP